MTKRWPLIITGSCILVAIVFWAGNPSGAGSSADEARYEKWKELHYLCLRSLWWKEKLPPALARSLRINVRLQKYIEERQELSAVLVASGYLTNLTLPSKMTNSMQVDATFNRLRKAGQNYDALEMSFFSNAVVITCRPQDESVCRQAMQP